MIKLYEQNIDTSNKLFNNNSKEEIVCNAVFIERNFLGYVVKKSNDNNSAYEKLQSKGELSVKIKDLPGVHVIRCKKFLRIQNNLEMACIGACTRLGLLKMVCSEDPNYCATANPERINSYYNKK
ncbi:MAG: hypothetical protein QXW97_04280 [Candidatus Pacearchaeota archaeon]